MFYQDPDLLLLQMSPEDRLRTSMGVVNVASLPFRAVGTAIELAMQKIMESHPLAEQAALSIGNAIQNCIPETLKKGWEEERVRTIEIFERDYGISPAETNYYLDSVSEVCQNLLTISLGCIAKGAAKGVVKVAQKIHITHLNKMKFLKASQAGEICGKIPLDAGGYMDVLYTFGENQRLKLYIGMVEATDPSKSHGVLSEAIRKIKQTVEKVGAKELHIEACIVNEDLMKFVNKRFKNITPPLTVNGHDIWNIPVKNPSSAISFSPLLTSKDIAPISAIGMMVSHLSISLPESKDKDMILKNENFLTDPNFFILKPPQHLSEEKKFSFESSGSGENQNQIGPSIQPASLQSTSRSSPTKLTPPIEETGKTLESSKSNRVLDIGITTSLNSQSPNAIDQDPAPSLLLETFQKAIPAIEKMADQFLKNDKEIDQASLQIKLDQELVQIEQIEKEITEQKESQYWPQTIQAASIILSGIMDCVAGKQRDRESLAQFKNLNKHFQQEHKQMQLYLERQKIGTPVLELSSHNYQSSRDYFTHLHDMVANYKQDVNKLNQRLEDVQAQQASIRSQQMAIAQLDETTSKLYQQLIEKKQKLGTFRIVAQLIRTTGAVLSCIPVTAPLGVALVAGGTAAEQATSIYIEGHVKNLTQQYQNQGSSNLESNQTLTRVASDLNSEETAVKTEQFALRKFDREDGHKVLNPALHREVLNNDIKAIEREKNEIKERIDNQKKKIDDEKAKLELNKFEECKLWKKRYLKQRTEKQAEITKRETLLVQMEKDLNTLEGQEKQKKNEKEETEHTLDEANYLSDLREIEHNILAKQNPDANETKEAKHHRELVEKAIFQNRHNANVWEAAHQPWDNMAKDMIFVAGDLLKLIEKIVKTKQPEKVDQLIALASQSWDLLYLINKSKDVFSKNIKAFCQNHGKDALILLYQGQLSGPASAEFAAIFVYNLLIPIMRGLILTHNSWTTFKELGSESKPMEDKFETLKKAIQELQQTEHHVWEKVIKVNSTLIMVGDQLLSLVEKGFENLQKEMQFDAYKDYLKISVTSGLNLKLKTRQYKNKITESSGFGDEIERHKKMRDFLSFIDSEGLDSAIEDHYSGFTKGNSTHQDNLKIFPCVSLGLIYRNPDYFTPLLANILELGTNEPNYKKGVPNWFLFHESVKHFLDMIQTLRQQPIVDKKATIGKRASIALMLQENQQIKQFILTICQKINNYAKEIESLHTLLPHIVGQLIKTRNKVWYESSRRTQQMRSLKTGFQLKALELSLKSFCQKLHQKETQNIVGAEKFFLHRELNEKPFLEQLPTLNFQKIFDENYYGSQTIARVCDVSSFFFRMGVSGALSFGIGPIVTILYFGATKINTGSFPENDWSGAKLNNNQLKMEKYRSLTLKALSMLRSEEVSLTSPVTISQRQDAFNFDLKQKKFTLIQPHLKKKQDPHLLVDIDTGERENYAYAVPKIGIQFQETSPIQPTELDKIPTPNGVAFDADLYNASVGKLMSDYTYFLFNILAEKSVDVTNPFKVIQTTCQVIPSFNDELMPLALPKELIEACEKCLSPELHAFESTASGTLIPYYDFCVKEGILSLHFRFISEGKLQGKKDLQGQKFCRINIAKFDSKTLRCFQTDLESDGSIAVNEFLIQAIYTSFAMGLGLPGKETYETTGLLLAPKEVGFQGLYKLWEFDPESMIEYDSQSYSEEIRQHLIEATKKGKNLSLEAEQIFRPLVVHLEEDYLLVSLETKNKQQKLIEVEKKFSEDFSVLLAMVKLLSKVDNKTLYIMMEKYFGIIPQFYHDEFVRPTICLTEDKTLRTISSDVIHLFLLELKLKPSEKLSEMRDQLEKIDEITAFVSSSELRVNVASLNLVNSISVNSFSSIPVLSSTLVGLPNILNSCYMNAPLQVLLASNFKQDVMALPSIEKIDNGLIRNIKHLKNFMDKKHAKGIKESLLAIRESLFDSYCHPEFSDDMRYAQHDAGAFVSAFLSNFNYEFAFEERRSGFDIQNNQTITMTYSVNQNMLYLPMGMNSTSTLMNLLHGYFNETVTSKEGIWQPEENGKICCVPNSTIIRRFNKSLPKMLVLQLGRYSRNPAFKQEKPKSETNRQLIKLDQAVEMPANGTLDLSRYLNENDQTKAKYRLRGCVDHHGERLDGGHYTAYVREGERWYYMNDDLVLCEVNFDQVKRAEHYLYFFEKEE